MPSSTTEPRTEAEWQARNDARTLAHAKEIEADTARHNAAREQAAKMLVEEQEELAALRKVVGNKKNTGKQRNTTVQDENNRGSQFNSFHKII